LSGSQSAETVRPRYDPESAVRFITIVEVKSNRDQSVQDCYRWLNEQFTLLFRPSVVFGIINPLGNRYAEILVNRYQPVTGRRLREQRTLNGSGVGWKSPGQTRIPGKSIRKLSTPRTINEAARAGNAIVNVAHETLNTADFPIPHDIWNDGISARRQLLGNQIHLSQRIG
jgi:hypothetical protein